MDMKAALVVVIATICCSNALPRKRETSTTSCVQCCEAEIYDDTDPEVIVEGSMYNDADQVVDGYLYGHYLDSESIDAIVQAEGMYLKVAEAQAFVTGSYWGGPLFVSGNISISDENHLSGHLLGSYTVQGPLLASAKVVLKNGHAHGSLDGTYEDEVLRVVGGIHNGGNATDGGELFWNYEDDDNLNLFGGIAQRNDGKVSGDLFGNFSGSPLDVECELKQDGSGSGYIYARSRDEVLKAEAIIDYGINGIDRGHFEGEYKKGYLTVNAKINEDDNGIVSGHLLGTHDKENRILLLNVSINNDGTISGEVRVFVVFRDITLNASLNVANNQIISGTLRDENSSLMDSTERSYKLGLFTITWKPGNGITDQVFGYLEIVFRKGPLTLLANVRSEADGGAYGALEANVQKRPLRFFAKLKQTKDGVTTGGVAGTIRKGPLTILGHINREKRGTVNAALEVNFKKNPFSFYGNIGRSTENILTGSLEANFRYMPLSFFGKMNHQENSSLSGGMEGHFTRGDFALSGNAVYSKVDHEVAANGFMDGRLISGPLRFTATVNQGTVGSVRSDLGGSFDAGPFQMTGTIKKQEEATPAFALKAALVRAPFRSIAEATRRQGGAAEGSAMVGYEKGGAEARGTIETGPQYADYRFSFKETLPEDATCTALQELDQYAP